MRRVGVSGSAVWCLGFEFRVWCFGSSGSYIAIYRGMEARMEAAAHVTTFKVPGCDVEGLAMISGTNRASVGSGSCPIAWRVGGT